MLQTLWVRHGESVWNRLGRMQGQTPWPPLTATGLQQAHAVAQRLATGERPHRLLSSDLCRAVQTASIIAKRLNLQVETTPLLRERCWGIYEGKPVRDGHLSEAKMCAYQRVPQGESREDVADRVRELFADIAEAGPIIVVTHGDVIREAVALLSEGSAHALSIRNGCVVPLLVP
ncbi:histidine phosphatase family protein [Mycobacterium paragordonae]|jgi:broad specificity phosphatase PhoE|uniref:histidine phosphatase family protein n=1 Tax=Mycobacterium paragordonae TaxID=1389713 RepID=UPI0012E10AAE|nr:histidine phosphatase family protein [Mycobacterium paragordonae]